MRGALGKEGSEIFDQKKFFYIILNYNMMIIIGEKIGPSLLSTKINFLGVTTFFKKFKNKISNDLHIA